MLQDVGAAAAADAPAADGDAAADPAAPFDEHEQSDPEPDEDDFQRPASLKDTCTELFALSDPDRVSALLGLQLGPRWSYTLQGAGGAPAIPLGRIEEWGGARTLWKSAHISLLPSPRGTLISCV